MSGDIYSSFDLAFRYFNSEFFDGILPDCVFTLQRIWRVKGYFAGLRFLFPEGERSEIAVNPSYFGVLSDEEILSTLVHEMCHLHQFVIGKKSSEGYHSVSWADDMERCGLCPSSTGKPGGKKTGYRITQYIPDGSFFLGHCRKLESEGFSISFKDKVTDEGVMLDVSGNTRVRNGLSGKRVCYSCQCGCRVWGKGGLSLSCKKCGGDFLPVVIN